MRLLLLFCLVLGSISTTWGEEPEKHQESDLARSYYSAIEENDHKAAEKALAELKKRFPDDAITRLVAAHWRQRTEPKEFRSWGKFKDSRRRNDPDQKPAADHPELLSKIYAVADLVVPMGPQGQENSKLSKNIDSLVELISDSCLEKLDHERVAFHEKNLALIVRGTEKTHATCEKLLRQLRKPQDVQLMYEIKLASIEPKIANTFSLRETISPAVMKERLSRISDAKNSTLVMAPIITLLNDQIASIQTSSSEENSSIELHGKVGNSRQALRTEFQFSISDLLGKEVFKFATSELIPDGQTAVFFIKSEDASSAFFDRRLLIEKGMDVTASESNQLFLFLTPKILIIEAEEEILGAKPPLPRYAPRPYRQTAYPQVQPKVPAAWTPAKLNWDDRSWNLDFSGKEELPPDHPWNLNWPPYPGAIRYMKTGESIPELLPAPVLER